MYSDSDGSLRQRASRHDTFMGVAQLFGRRSSCPRASVGCVATLEGRIIASGYVGAPSGQPHCIDVGCELEGGHCVRTIHAEANLVAWAARVGTPLLGSTVWCTHSPCHRCAQLLANAGISQVVWAIRYDPHTLHYLNGLGVKTAQIDRYEP